MPEFVSRYFSLDTGSRSPENVETISSEVGVVLSIITDFFKVIGADKKPDINIRTLSIQKDLSDELAELDPFFSGLASKAKKKLLQEKETRTLPLETHCLLGLAAFDGFRKPQEAIQLGMKMNDMLGLVVYSNMCGRSFLKYKYENQYVIDAKGPRHIATHWRLTEKGLNEVATILGVDIPNGVPAL